MQNDNLYAIIIIIINYGGGQNTDPQSMDYLYMDYPKMDYAAKV